MGAPSYDQQEDFGATYDAPTAEFGNMSVNDSYDEGYAEEGYAEEGYAEEGYAEEGYDEGYAEEGYAEEGYAEEGYDEGYYEEGYEEILLMLIRYLISLVFLISLLMVNKNLLMSYNPNVFHSSWRIWIK